MRALGFMLVLVATPAFARDWYVRAGSSETAGTAAAPIGALHLALEEAEPGDRVHVAAGQYTGRDGRGELTLDADGVSVLGGYSPDFAVRDPLVYRTLLQRTPNSAAAAEVRPVLWVRGAADVTLEGLVIDGSARAVYDEQGNLVRDLSPLVPLVELEEVEGATLRQLTVLNGPWIGVRASLEGGALLIERCTFVNHVGHALDVVGLTPGDVRIVDSVFAFTWRWRSLGGNALRLAGVRSARIEESVLGYGEAASVLVRQDVQALSLRRNVLLDPIALVSGGASVAPEMLETAGTLQSEGNVTAARLQIDPTFAARWETRRLPGERGAVEPFAPLRRGLGLAPQEPPVAGRAWAFAYPVAALPKVLWKGTQAPPRAFVPMGGTGE